MREGELITLVNDIQKNKIEDELRIATRANIEDIKTNHLEKYLLEIREKKTNLASLSNEKICRLQGFCENDKPTLAGVMMFSDYPQAFFPQLCITAVSIPGTEMSETGSVGERFIDNMRIDGTFTQMINNALIFTRKNIKTTTIIDSNTGKRVDRTEYPIIAVRELIINALVHRDYSIHTDSTPITIKIFTNRLEIENPGGLYGRMTLDKLGKVSADTRNPFIANALEILGETENRYSGIPTILNLMEEYGLPKPLFESERGVFRVTLYNKSFSDGKQDSVKLDILNFCKTPKSRMELENYFKGKLSIAYVMSKYIHPMVEEGVISLTIPSAPKSKNQKFVKQK